MTRLIVAVVAVAAACGGQGKKSAEEPHGELPPPVAAFHDRLSPLWHAAPGEKRTEETCAALPSFRELAMNLVTSIPPEPATADEEGWRDATSALVSAVEDLDRACAAPGRADFETKFSGVHDQFHAVMERSVPHS